MNRKNTYLLAIVALAALLGALGFFARAPRLQSVEINSPDAAPIVSALKETYRLKLQLACDPTVDVRLLETVMVDTPDYPLNDHQKQTIRVTLGELALNAAGYLTWSKAYYLEARGSFVGPTPAPPAGVRPTPRPIFACPAPLREQELTFKSISMNEDRAEAQFDDGPALEQAVLVKINGQWFVASLNPLQIHL